MANPVVARVAPRGLSDRRARRLSVVGCMLDVACCMPNGPVAHAARCAAFAWLNSVGCSSNTSWRAARCHGLVAHAHESAEQLLAVQHYSSIRRSLCSIPRDYRTNYIAVRTARGRRGRVRKTRSGACSSARPRRAALATRSATATFVRNMRTVDTVDCRHCGLLTVDSVDC